LKTINLFFSYLLREWKFGPARNYKKWGHPLRCGRKFTFMFLLMLRHIVPNWRPTWVVKHGARNSQMLRGTKNIVYKGKSLHVHINNKNHILENQNDKHTHYFLIHLYIKNIQIHDLTPKGWRHFSSKTPQNCHF
jgi:hypothetical protein